MCRPVAAWEKSTTTACRPVNASSAGRARLGDAGPADEPSSYLRTRWRPRQPPAPAWSWTHKYTVLYVGRISLVEEAGLGACVAGRPRRADFQQHRIRVAVETHIHNLHHVAG